MREPEDPGGPGDYLILLSDAQELPVDHDALVAFAAHALASLGIAPGAHLSISLAGAEAMADLKARALGERAPTDVLSFPMDDPDDPAPGPVVLGDVVLCPDVAARQARALGRAVDEEMRLLLAHGILHLLGRDHADAAGESAMSREERRILEALRAREMSGEPAGATP